MTCKPFPKDLELNKELDIPSSYPQNGLTPDKGNGTEISHRSAVPGQPLHCLDSSDVSHYLPDEILTPDLNRLAPSLWLVGIQQSSHISPLNRQIIKGREIHIAENIELHCTWIYDRVFFKPIPPRLLSWAFWQHFLVLGSSSLPEPLRLDLHKAVSGYLRTLSPPYQAPLPLSSSETTPLDSARDDLRRSTQVLLMLC